MVAHSGSLPATIKAIEVVDKAVGELVQEVLARNGTVVITADHGNAEELLTYPIASFFVTSKQGSINTEHSNNPVPVYIINKRFQGKKLKRLEGSLADVAPTILAMMGMQKPQEMIGKNLLEGAKV
jgi:2,3-bisphosphoglycerate-independent phosphoglycerate mutase